MGFTAKPRVLTKKKPPTAEAVAAHAQKRYAACAPCAPLWDQLGDVTKKVWLEQATKELS